MRHFWYEWGGLITGILLIVLIIGGCTAGLVKLDEVGCYAQTADMGYDARWGVWTGCQIEVESGKWIPLDSYYFKEE